ncbi:MAG: hypothetical protein H0T56_05660, partial [Pseudaminobacter sp.]|nr:hypothetical protein [Pseudaminobacter sp.]
MAGESNGEGNRPGRKPKAKTNDAREAAVRVAETAAIPVIGIGASAGGIEALGLFFDAMPTDCGCAFVV